MRLNNSLIVRMTKRSELSKEPQYKPINDVENLAAEFQGTSPLTRGAWMHVLTQVVTVATLLYVVVSQVVAGGLWFSLLVFWLLELGWARASARARNAERVILTAHLGHDRINDLVEIAHWPGRDLRQIARLHLLRLVRDVAPGEHDDMLDEHHSAMLVNLLTPFNALVTPGLVVAVLQMYTRTGDSTALPVARNLVRFPMRPSVYRAAKACTNQLAATWRSTGGTGTEINEQMGAPAIAGQPTQSTLAPPVTRRRDTIGMRGGFFIASVISFVPFGIYNTVRCAMDGNWMGVPLFLGVAISPMALVRLTMRQSDVKRVRSIVANGKPESIGFLVDALDWPDAYCRNLASRGLSVLLPQVKASDGALLNQHQRTVLLRYLKLQNVVRYEKLLIAILQALEQIGDESSIPAVELLAASDPVNSAQVRVRDAAEHCLRFLPEVAAAKTASQTLLRASEPAEDRVSDLLRAPTSQVTFNDEQLVRPLTDV